VATPACKSATAIAKLRLQQECILATSPKKTKMAGDDEQKWKNVTEYRKFRVLE